MLVDLLWTQSCLLRKLTQQGSYEVYPVAAHTAGSSDIHPKVVCQSFVKEVGSCGALRAGWYTAAGCQSAVKVGFCVALGAGWYTAAGCQPAVKVGVCVALGAGWYTAADCQPVVKVGVCVALGAGWYTAVDLKISLQVGSGECHYRLDGFQGILTNRWMMKTLLDVVGDSIG